MEIDSHGIYHPKVSIIITTYNRANLLENAITGALIQNYPNLEIIISDNASTDDTPEIVAKYMSNKNLNYVRHDKNIGALANHNISLREYASGEWVVFVSDDDCLDNENFVTDAIDLIRNYGPEEVAFLQTGVYTLYPDGKKILGVPNIEKEVGYFKRGEYFLRYFDLQYFSFTTTIFNRDLALRFDILNDEHYGTDVELMLLMSFYKDTILVKKPYGVYRIHDNQHFRESDQDKLFKMFSTYENVYKHALKMGIDKVTAEKWLDDARTLHYTDIVNNMIYRHNRRYEQLLSEAIDTISYYYSTSQRQNIQIRKVTHLHLYFLYNHLKVKKISHDFYKFVKSILTKALHGNNTSQ